ncbi:hypothetical protein MUK42_13538 [Musa troglodytarum]|uniref:PHD finger protein ALFIN-LIKE n=1 Tax=Musa troglodytarum TaxID=320322 RepID=A0A9E7I3G3_9LILI|nr:hypothetical protein MUK42_13538 [Musa troglodytarum]
MDLGRRASTYRRAEDLFTDFRGRRAGFVKALTTDFTKFYQQCDPEKGNLCLYAFADETWEVRERPEKVPTEFPELVRGINLARDVTEEKRWLADVACHSDAWLISFPCTGACALALTRKLDLSSSSVPVLCVKRVMCDPFVSVHQSMRQLFVMINALPTISEVLLGAANTSKDGPSSKKDSRRGRQIEKDVIEVDDDDDDTCGVCWKTHRQGEFWMCCDVCKTWYHAKLVILDLLVWGSGSIRSCSRPTPFSMGWRSAQFAAETSEPWAAEGDALVEASETPERPITSLTMLVLFMLYIQALLGFLTASAFCYLDYKREFTVAQRSHLFFPHLSISTSSDVKVGILQAIMRSSISKKPYMCLYGCPNETWELKEPPDGPHELPEPNIGVNFARDGMPEKDWLAHVAIHSDAWLYSYAFYVAIRAGLDAETRCVAVTPEQLKSIKQYRCPSCCSSEGAMA